MSSTPTKTAVKKPWFFWMYQAAAYLQNLTVAIWALTWAFGGQINVFMTIAVVVLTVLVVFLVTTIKSRQLRGLVWAPTLKSRTVVNVLSAVLLTAFQMKFWPLGVVLIVMAAVQFFWGLSAKRHTTA